MKVVWSVSAENDLDAIVDYIANDNIESALSLDDLIRQAADGLSAFPYKGKHGRVAGTRELVVRTHYIIVYAIAHDSVEIVTVLHTSRQYPPEQLFGMLE